MTNPPSFPPRPRASAGPPSALLALLALFFCAAAHPASASLRLPGVFGDHMVLQSDRALPFWGWAKPGEKVVVAAGGSSASTSADPEGRWQLRLPARRASADPITVKVSAGGETVTFSDVLVGEVWVCSGQSNMEWSVARSKNPNPEIAAAGFPNIRLFHIPRRPSGVPLPDVQAEWRPCSPESVRNFSAVAYYFGRKIHRELDVPVGLVNTSWGGTRIEPWTPPVGFAAVPKLDSVSEQIEEADAKFAADGRARIGQLEAWIKESRQALDAGGTLKPVPEWPKHPLEHHQRPTGLYNGMVNGIVPYAIRGALWYQGESNRGDPLDGARHTYVHKMAALIKGWREVWDQGDFPFLFVQLAPFRYGGDPLLLPLVWEAQTATLKLPKTGMAVTNDTVDNIRDIHPVNKQDVGARLAQWALAKTYGKRGLVHSGPLYDGLDVEGSKARVSFRHTGSGLATRDGKAPSHFEIAGADRVFHPAEASLDGHTVVVHSPEVESPVAVRFAWHQEAQPNLMNKEKLPASAFRSDRWRHQP